MCRAGESSGCRPGAPQWTIVRRQVRAGMFPEVQAEVQRAGPVLQLDRVVRVGTPGRVATDPLERAAHQAAEAA